MTTKAGGSLVWSTPPSSGDMLRSTYDANANSKVDSAETADNATQLGGQAASYYTNAGNIATGVLAVARLPDLDAAKISSGKLAIDRLPIPATQLPTGTIIVEQASVARPRAVAIYARVSSHDQKDDLERQVGRLTSYAVSQHLPATSVVTDLPQV